MDGHVRSLGRARRRVHVWHMLGWVARAYWVFARRVRREMGLLLPAMIVWTTKGNWVHCNHEVKSGIIAVFICDENNM
jgi:hypothetical protein